MRRLFHVFLLAFILGYLAIDLRAQQCVFCESGCNFNYVNAEKIFVNGKAPWAIDGQIEDWKTFILGPSTGDNFKPFELPKNSAFNWAIDGDNEQEVDPDKCSPEGDELDFFDTPTPDFDQNIRLSAFMHDDYNVFFYFRRLANNNSPNSFYYFCDVNADGYMNEVEPVFHATFPANGIITLTLSRYIPDTDTRYFFQGKGNPLAIIQENENGTPSEAPIVQDYPMPGSLEKVFSSKNIPFKHRLKKKEIFAAALTEEGYGVELAIPWRYLKFWLVNKKKEKKSWKVDKNKENLKHLSGAKWKETKSLKAGEIFFYKLSMKQGDGEYEASEVVDNVGNTCDGVGKSGDVSFTKSISTPMPIHNSDNKFLGFRFRATYINLSNATEVFNIAGVALNNIEFNSESTNVEGISVKVYLDKNCNGEVDLPEDKNAMGSEPIGENVCIEPQPSFEGGLVVETRPFEKACYIFDILPSTNNLIESADVEIQPTIDFIPKDPCNSCTLGRMIKRVGVTSTSLTLAVSLTTHIQSNEVLQNGNSSAVLVYPNPNYGTAQVYLPTKEGAVDLIVEDYLGRKVQQWNNFTSNSLQINNLKPGLYLLRVFYLKTGKVETQRILVQ